MFGTHASRREAMYQLDKDNCDKYVIARDVLLSDTYTDLAAKTIAEVAFASADLAINSTDTETTATYNGKSDIPIADNITIEDTQDLVVCLADSASNIVARVVDAVDINLSGSNKKISFSAFVLRTDNLKAAA